MASITQKTASEKSPEKTTPEKPSDGVLRRGDAEKPGTQVGNLYVYRVSETGAAEPGIEKDRNQQPRAHCGMTGIQGYLVNVRENKSRFNKDKEDEQTFDMLEICLTRKTFGIRDAEEGEQLAQAKLLEPGQSILVPGNHALSPLFPYAEHPTHTVEIALIPGDKAKKATANGFFPRNWEIRVVSKEAVLRSSIANLAALPALPEVTAPALPSLPGTN